MPDAAAQTPVNPQAAGLHPAGLQRLRDAFAQSIERGRWPGSVLYIERRGAVGCFEALGQQNAGAGVAMRTDSIFRIYSMTKPLVSVAAMMLFEQGRLLLNDPVAKYLPEFAEAAVGVERDGGLVTAPPRHTMTVQDLLRHTAGLGYEIMPPSAVNTLYIEAKVGAYTRSNREVSRLIASLPLRREPGTAWEYSRATDVLGALVEVVAGQTLGEFLQQHILAPLAMVDTGFVVPAAQQHRVAEPFAVDPDSGAPVRLIDVTRKAAFESGGGGMVSTAADYARFLRLMLAGGTLDGVRLLGPKTVRYMTADHLGGLPVASPPLLAGHGFGLGFGVRLQHGVAPINGSAGTYYWGGMAGTVFFVDPAEELFAIMLTQAPGQRTEARSLFHNLVYAALER